MVVGPEGEGLKWKTPQVNLPLTRKASRCKSIPRTEKVKSLHSLCFVVKHEDQHGFDREDLRNRKGGLKVGQQSQVGRYPDKC